MVKRLWLIAALLTPGLMVGCGSSTPPADQPAAQADAPKVPIPPDSPFAKVKEGMGYDEVVSTIGPPTSEPYMYQTGKAFIPFHYGGDNFRKRAHYKGIGTITFSSNSSFSGSMSVMSIDYDPTDKGFEPGT